MLTTHAEAQNKELGTKLIETFNQEQTGFKGEMLWEEIMAPALKRDPKVYLCEFTYQADGVYVTLHDRRDVERYGGHDKVPDWKTPYISAVLIHKGNTEFDLITQHGVFKCNHENILWAENYYVGVVIDKEAEPLLRPKLHWVRENNLFYFMRHWGEDETDTVEHGHVYNIRSIDANQDVYRVYGDMRMEQCGNIFEMRQNINVTPCCFLTKEQYDLYAGIYGEEDGNGAYVRSLRINQ